MLVAVSLISGCGASSEGALPSTASAVCEVRPGTVAPVTLLAGELAAERATVVSGPSVNVWPLTVRWVIEDGERVHAGDRLLEFDNQSLVATLEDLEASLIEAETSLSAARAGAETARRDAMLEVARRQAALDRAALEAAVPPEMVSEREFNRLQTVLEKARVEADSAVKRLELGRLAGEREVSLKRVALNRVRTELQTARSAIDALVLTAPADGVALVANAMREGRRLQPGDEVWPGYVVVRIPELESMVVQAWLSDVDDGAISVGDSATVVLDALPDETLSGSVRAVETIAREVGATGLRRAFRVTIDVTGLRTEVMRPGMSVKVVVANSPVEGLVIPRTAVVWGDDTTALRRPDGSLDEVDLGPCDARFCLVEAGAASGSAVAVESE